MINKITRLIYLLTISAALILTSCSDDNLPGGERQKVTEYKIAVIMPASGNNEWKRTAAWALENIEKAQSHLSDAVRLDIEWHDEDASDLGSILDGIAADESCKAVIGPMSSANARLAAERMKGRGKALILPIATSTEFQREHAADGNVWNLAQSDMTQCEILLTQALLSGNPKVSLLTTTDDYGKSYTDWFAYEALELNLTVDRIITYDNENELRNAVRWFHESEAPYLSTLIFAPSKSTDAVVFDNEFGQIKSETGSVRFPLLLCTDMVNSREVASKLMNREYEGINPSANPASGFICAYRGRFGAEPVSGEAHLYDAITMTAYALAAGGDSDINATLHRLLSSGSSEYRSWLPDDMARTFADLRNGNTPNLDGVTGNWDFDAKYGTTVLNTIYAHWILRDGVYTTLEYLSADGGDRTTSTLQAWDYQTSNFQQFDNGQSDPDYGERDENWAVVISTSDTWANYRHQADALAMYQLLKRHGYDDDHIILIMEDNIAYDPHNIHPGTVRVRPDGENLYTDVKTDYKLSEISMTDFQDIMNGKRSARLPDVIESDNNDNVIVFWTGHGADSHLSWGSAGMVMNSQIENMVQSMHSAGKYRKLMLVMDACYSGTIGESLVGIPGVLAITAANAYEPSKADIRDPEMGIWLSNGFTRVFQETIDENPSISIRDLYYTVARYTVGSHATIYNTACYGNLFRNSMKEFIKP